MDARQLDIGRLSPSLDELDRVLTLTRRPATLWHVLQVPVHRSDISSGRLRVALPCFNVPKDRLVYQDLLPESDSALVPLLSAANRSKTTSSSVFTSDQGDLSDSLVRSSMSSDFDFEPVAGVSHSKVECVLEDQKTHQRCVDSMYVSKVSRKC